MNLISTLEQQQQQFTRCPIWCANWIPLLSFVSIILLFFYNPFEIPLSSGWTGPTLESRHLLGLIWSKMDEKRACKQSDWHWTTTFLASWETIKESQRQPTNWELEDWEKKWLIMMIWGWIKDLEFHDYFGWNDRRLENLKGTDNQIAVVVSWALNLVVSKRAIFTCQMSPTNNESKAKNNDCDLVAC